MRHACSDRHDCDLCVMDRVHSALERPGVESSLAELFRWLLLKRQCESDASWTTWVQSFALQHPIRQILHGDPFTASAFHKPRGFPGDATTLDFMYAANIPEWSHLVRGTLPSTLDSVSRYITTQRPSAHAVVGRTRLFASYIDELSNGGGRVLSVAGGHFRESALSTALRSSSVEEVVVLDQDPLALDEVRRTCNGLPVTVLHASIRSLLTNKLQVGDFDLIYSGGLFDYLANRTASTLLDALVERLRPSGRIVVANFRPDHPDLGYMESFMDWRLIYRDESDLSALVNAMAHRDEITTSTWIDKSKSLAYLGLQKSGAGAAA